MKVLRPLITLIVKELFLQQEKKDVKELVLERIAEDSKELGLVLFFINLSAITFILSLFVISILFINQAGHSLSSSMLYTGIILIVLSISIVVMCFIFLKKKISLYKNISDIKKDARDFSWLSPLFEELSLEHQKMKNKFQQK